MSRFSKYLCCPRKKQVLMEDRDLHPFVAKKLPIFWIMGPPCCGKSTLAEMLADSSKYNLIKIDGLVNDDIMKGKWRGQSIFEYLEKGKKIPDDIIINLIKEALLRSQDYSIGYVIDGFPRSIAQAKLFEKKVCNVTIIIYVTLVLDAVLARKITQVGAFDPNEQRINHIKHTNRLTEVAKKYEHKTIKLNANYPPENTCTRLVEDLEDFWGYKFLHLYNKNQ